jgi:hypothetical protein
MTNQFLLNPIEGKCRVCGTTLTFDKRESYPIGNPTFSIDWYLCENKHSIGKGVDGEVQGNSGT